MKKRKNIGTLESKIIPAAAYYKLKFEGYVPCPATTPKPSQPPKFSREAVIPSLWWGVGLQA
jgi:hypothetical protein